MRFVGTPLPGVDLDRLTGHLVALEGPDYAGRSTLCAHLTEALESQGHAVLSVSLGSSRLLGEAIAEAKRGNLLGRVTMTLMYATDFADLLENSVIPALKAGFVVLADRYIYSMMARSLVRDGEFFWLENLFSFALVPDLCVYLDAPPEVLVHRGLQKLGRLDYWESGMDLGLSTDMYDSFMRYQEKIAGAFKRVLDPSTVVRIDASRGFEEVAEEIEGVIAGHLT